MKRSDILVHAVAVEMESGVVQLMVEHVCIAMVTQGQSAEVIEWAAKALAHAAPNGIQSTRPYCCLVTTCMS